MTDAHGNEANEPGPVSGVSRSGRSTVPADDYFWTCELTPPRPRETSVTSKPLLRRL